MAEELLPDVRRVGIRDVTFGAGVIVIEPVNLYECRIGAGTFVGPFVEIQRGVEIGKRCRIQSHTFICELVTIGDDCFIGHGVMFINDPLRTGAPAGGNRSLWQSTQIEANVYVGSNVSVLPVRIGSHVVIGAGSVVTRDIDEPGIYAGNPARKISSV